MASNYRVLGLPLDTDDTETKIMVDSALMWVAENTTLEIGTDNELPSNVKLFVIKYCDLMSQTYGVASESLGGMSQSFSTSGGAGFLLALEELASQLFGSAYKGRRNRFVTAQSRWK